MKCTLKENTDMLRNVARACFLIVIICPLASLAQTKEKTSPPSWFWGCWVVSKPLPTPGVSGLALEQVRAISGTRVIYQPSYARSGQSVASGPEYSTTTLTSQEFLSLGYVRLKQIGIPDDSVIRVQLVKPEFSDLVFPGNDVFLRKSDLVIEVENNYFVAERAKPQDSCKFTKTEGK
jgi:hypothetical protein